MSKFIRFGSVEEGLNKMLFLPLHVCTPLGLGTYVPPYFYAVGVSRPPPPQWANLGHHVVELDKCQYFIYLYLCISVSMMAMTICFTDATETV